MPQASAPGTPLGRAWAGAGFGLLGLAVPLLPSILALALGVVAQVEAGRRREPLRRALGAAAIVLAALGAWRWGSTFSASS
jgi:chromate transport protein ChrA